MLRPTFPMFIVLFASLSVSASASAQTTYYRSPAPPPLPPRSDLVFGDHGARAAAPHYYAPPDPAQGAARQGHGGHRLGGSPGRRRGLPQGADQAQTQRHISSHASLAQQPKQQIKEVVPAPDTLPAPAARATTVKRSDSAKDAATPANEDAIKSDDTFAQPKQDAIDAAKNDSKIDNTTEPKQHAPAPAAEPPKAAITADAKPAPVTIDTKVLALRPAYPAKDAAAPANEDAIKSDDTVAQPKQDAVDAAKNKIDNTAEPKQHATVPAAEPAKATAASDAAPERNAVAEQLRELVIGKRFGRFVPRKEDRAGVDQYYKAHDYQPIWTNNGAANARAKAAISFLRQVETVGLISSDYPTPDFASAVTPEDLAAAELHLTASVVKYARDAQVGRIHFSRVGRDISFKPYAPDPVEELTKLAGAEDVAKTLDSYNPPQAGFKALKEKLAELRANGGEIAKPEKKSDLVRMPAGKILRPGMKGKRVLILRQRLDIAGDKESQVYDNDVFDAVRAFQTKADIKVNGIIDPNTVAALNGEGTVHSAPANPIDTIIVNMERWRWLPRKLGNANEDNAYVIVNVPDYTLSLFRDNKLYWKTKIVVGKPSKATPMTSAEMKYITVNPTWNVPPSIIKNEYLPALEQDPTVLDRYGLKIYQDRDGIVHIYQPPGAGNALGRIRFNFPNKFLVYQHDTPDKYLFKRAKRAYSHGCMRVQDPLEYATKLLSIELPQDHYTPAKLESMYGSNEVNIHLPKPIPVHLTYQTVFVDENGKLQFRDDVYGRDARMIQILKSSERKVAYIPIKRAPGRSAQAVRLPVGTFGRLRTAQSGSGGRQERSWRASPGLLDLLASALGLEPRSY